MSDKLPMVDLTTAVVGSSGKVALPLPGLVIDANGQRVPSYVRMMNESGDGLSVIFSDGNADFIPAGAWPVFQVDPTTTGFSWNVAYIIPNAPISQLQVIYYYPGEPVPQAMTLGNSPIGITGSVTTAGSTLSNEGNPINTLVIDIGDATNSKLMQWFTDHFIIAVDQSGVSHTVLKGNTAGNPLQIGQAGDIAEVVGKLTVDQLTTAAAALGVTGGTTTDTLSVTGNATIGGTLGVTGNVTHSADTFLVNKKLSTASSGDLMDWSGSGVIMKGNPTSHGKFQYSGDGIDIDWAESASAGAVTGTGGGTFNHNLTQFGSALAPTVFDQNECTGAGSNALGFGSITTTQVTVGSLNAVAWKWKARA